MRLEVPSLMREFKDRMTFGRDPEGYLFYKDVDDLDPDQSSRYIMFPNVYKTKTEHAVVVKFFHNDPSRCYAQFIAKDENMTVDYTIDNGQMGIWTTLVQGSAQAMIKKASDENTVTLTVPAIGKKATFELNTDQSIKTWGEISYKRLSELTTPAGSCSFVDFNPDRLLLFPKMQSPDFTAVFIPSEALARPDALGATSVETDCCVERYLSDTFTSKHKLKLANEID
ncbi:unnamed protein product [Cyclocybe aegerita]|uniref:Uncharacterized protein n=1 Tax=Cyclocybe aegerita TaxID=1973307 RepID=A0A8S0XQK4_CYCAE|nr:unnamed protein product [Cyclocybe aegerita]